MLLLNEILKGGKKPPKAAREKFSFPPSKLVYFLTKYIVSTLSGLEEIIFTGEVTGQSH